MAVHNVPPLRCVVVMALMLAPKGEIMKCFLELNNNFDNLLLDVNANLQAYGCDQGWTDFKDYCYTVLVGDVVANIARNRCESMGASLSSVWSQEEKQFIVSLWQFPASDVEFLWLGLRGSDSGNWVFDDESSVTVKQGGKEWSVLDGVSGMPAAKPSKCLALRNSGTIAFLDCSMDADAFVCKKALPKVFITSSLLNHSSSVPSSPTGHVQLFERMFPPLLTSLPAENSRLAETSVATEVVCAFRCFSLTECQVFQVSCETSQNCGSLQCILYSDRAF